MDRSILAVASTGLWLCWSASAASPGFATDWQPAALYGGDVQVIAIDPRDPDYLLAGTSSGQIFSSPDGGESWSSAGDVVLFPGSVVSALIFDPDSSGRVWAALRGLWEESGSVAMSDDRGRTWITRSSGLPERQIYSLAAVPGAPGTLYAGTRTGVFGTDDHGRSWRHLTADRLEMQKITSLLVDGKRPQTIYAGTWRRPYRSDDAGATWKQIAAGMALDSEVFSLQKSPGREGELWASTCGGVYRGVELGESWTHRSKSLSVRRTLSFLSLPSGRVLAGTVGGVFFSDDVGFSWLPASGEPLVSLSLAQHPGRPEVVFAGAEGLGVWRSLDGGSSFEPINVGLSALRIAGLARVGDEVLAAVRHARGASGIYSSFDGGLSYSTDPVQLPAILGLAAEGRRLFAATERGLFERTDGVWQRLGGLDERRIDEVAVSDRRVVARSGDEVFEARGSVWQRIELGGVEPRDIALVGNTLWIADRSGRVVTLAQATDVVAGPVSNETLAAVLAADSRHGGGQSAGGTPRLLATGDVDWPFLLLRAGGSAVLVSSAARREMVIELGIEHKYLTGALVHRGRLLLATTGYGVLVSTPSWPSRATETAR